MISASNGFDHKRVMAPSVLTYGLAGLADATPPLTANGKITAQAPTATLRIELITPRAPFMPAP
jgi:hypothetical protein